jgi:hypothetical protein
MNWLKTKLAKLIIPSAWIEWLNGKKRILGIIQLALWALIYVVPAVRPEWAAAAAIGLTIQQYLTEFGVNFGSDLFVSGAAFTVVGLIDWISDHFFSDVATAGARKVEAAVVKAVKRKPAE